MSSAVAFAYPGDLNLKTGGYGYDRKVIDGLKALGWDVTLVPLGEGFPLPNPDVLRQAGEKLSGLPDGSLVIVDGLAYGVMDEWSGQEAERLKIIALVHHPLALETGLSRDEQVAFQAREVSALRSARHIIVTSESTALELVAHYEVDQADITVALPGTTKPTALKRNNRVPQILAVGSLTKRKGHDVLIAALARIADLEWQAEIVGPTHLDEKTALEIHKQISASGLDDRIILAGETDDVGPFFARADIFALASRYEGYGMVFAEALAHGLPIVACRAGAIPDVVPEDAGLLVPVDDVDAFASALRSLLIDEEERMRRAQASATAGARLPDWTETSFIISKVLRNLS